MYIVITAATNSVALILATIVAGLGIQTSPVIFGIGFFLGAVSLVTNKLDLKTKACLFSIFSSVCVFSGMTEALRIEHYGDIGLVTFGIVAVMISSYMLDSFINAEKQGTRFHSSTDKHNEENPLEIPKGIKVQGN